MVSQASKLVASNNNLTDLVMNALSKAHKGKKDAEISRKRQNLHAK